MMKFRGRSGRGQLEGDSGGNRGSCVEGVTAAIISGVTVTFGPFEVDSDRRLLLKNGDEVHLTPKAFDLLAVLLAEAPRVVRKEELHRRLWPDTFVSDATLVGLIKELRRAVDDRDSKRPIIRTTHGVGYAFAGEFRGQLAAVSAVSCWIVAGSRRIVLADGENLIGRDATSTVHLAAAGISRRHARVSVTGTHAVIEDLESKNGTLVNDTPATKPLVLQDGDRIQVGPIVVVYRASPSGVSTETIAGPSR
jgi:DNA-binding winged helix-turn-helix (wHTH) protein